MALRSVSIISPQNMTSDLPAPYAAPIDNKDGDSASVRCYGYEHELVGIGKESRVV
jgi:hypothetical protein